MTYQVIQPQVDCSNAQEFLEALSPLGPYFKNESPNVPWLFRGHGQDYDLIPSLFRKGGKLKALTRHNVESYRELLLAERDILIGFFRIADKRGLVLPDDSQELRSFLEMLKDNDFPVSEGSSGWQIETKGLSIMALAQHYGVPTRLLDWTFQPYIAAFFAAEDAYRHKEEFNQNSSLVVWVFKFPQFNKQTRYSHDSYIIRGVTAPNATNINLKAQQGIFTVVNPDYTEEYRGTYIPLDKVIEDQILKHSYSSELFTCTLQKFTLPVSESDKLLYLLAKLDITPSIIYPGYQSILSDLQMQNVWVGAKQ